MSSFRRVCRNDDMGFRDLADKIIQVFGGDDEGSEGVGFMMVLVKVWV